MSRLILINGPPASGKSTLATRFVDSHPLALNLDIDVVRRLLGGWTERPSDAGLLARKLAIAMARTALADGHDVIVPQLVARAESVLELERLARDTAAAFVEVALAASKDDMRDWFASRSASPDAVTHRDAELLVDHLGGAEVLDQMYDELVRLVASRPQTLTIAARRSDVDGTLRDLERLLTEVADKDAR